MEDGVRCISVPVPIFPALLEKQAARLFDPARDWILPDTRITDLDTFLVRAQKSGHELRCYDDALRFIADGRDRTHRSKCLRKPIRSEPGALH